LTNIEASLAHATAYAPRMAHFTFTDLDDGDETCVGVRATNDGVGLTLSKKANGDMEVFMRREVAVQLAAALRETADG
jgi:hypothetical protein